MRENIFLSLEFGRMKSRRGEEGGLKEEEEKRRTSVRKGRQVKCSSFQVNKYKKIAFMIA